MEIQKTFEKVRENAKNYLEIRGEFTKINTVSVIM